MDNLQRAKVSLLIHGDDLNPEQVTAMLGATPKIAARMGQGFLGQNGRTVTSKTGKWTFSHGWREPPCVDEQVSELFRVLPDGAEVWCDLTTRFDCYVAVGLYFAEGSWTGGMTLQPETLRILGERGLPIDFDMYAPASSD